MRTVTTWFAAVFVALGVGLYLATGMESVTALIPAFLGVGLGICAAVATTERRRMHAMHVAVVLALAGIGGGVPGIPDVLAHLGGEDVARPEAAWGRAVLAVLCVVYVVLAVRSFVQARRARQADG